MNAAARRDGRLDREETVASRLPPGTFVMLTPDARPRYPRAVPFGQVTGYGRGGSLRIRHAGAKLPVLWAAGYWLVDQEAELDRLERAKAKAP